MPERAERAAVPDDARRCPCGSGLTFGECCGPVLRGEREAATAEALMRSRFTAFAVGDVDWLLASWHSSTRPRSLELDPGIRWLRLDVLGTSDGGPFDREGTVTFESHWTAEGARGSMRELSRFRRDRGWQYVDGDQV
ncbi:YchJ family metal-binding protein [Agrococcus sp. BE272]|uniref:YchJ family protein n=1 Tax=Agrococcus sp. BE272 TaxID=2817727 RepID=UPI002860F7B3|nr:YchJ family metal-binding protein [Agrococcus sp. BE272]MDR7235278.1 SEC-C motif-containing protein [Agrococcus sp. BE272]